MMMWAHCVYVGVDVITVFQIKFRVFVTENG